MDIENGHAEVSLGTSSVAVAGGQPRDCPTSMDSHDDAGLISALRTQKQMSEILDGLGLFSPEEAFLAMQTVQAFRVIRKFSKSRRSLSCLDKVFLKTAGALLESMSNEAAQIEQSLNPKKKHPVKKPAFTK